MFFAELSVELELYKTTRHLTLTPTLEVYLVIYKEFRYKLPSFNIYIYIYFINLSNFGQLNDVIE